MYSGSVSVDNIAGVTYMKHHGTERYLASVTEVQEEPELCNGF